MRVDFKWNEPITDVSKQIINQDVRLFAANEAKRLMDPYVPARDLVLAQNVSIYTEGKYGVIEYRSPYAHYQYNGNVYVDPETGKAAYTNGEGRFWSRPGIAKVPTERKLKHSKFKHPLATSEWNKAMMVARRNDLNEAVQRFIRRNK